MRSQENQSQRTKKCVAMEIGKHLKTLSTIAVEFIFT